eukprot:TRINITY_DN60852_c0_g1_i1.p1 TRINITY_DN60852_c0_g1~~TRINITY_DN60852_c0_g1_i1.p1  ORF type:complete len:241 (+),score=48.08 TRINITY_DN60852_c0_g1_i1:89-724(+)
MSEVEEAGSQSAPASATGSQSLTVRLVSGAGQTITVAQDATVFDLRKAIEVAQLCPIPCQRLILGAEELTDSTVRVAELESSEILLVVGVSHGISEIHLRTGDVVDYIHLKQRDDTVTECGRRSGGEREPFLLQPHEYIVEVAWWREDYFGAACLKGVRFTTNTGRVSGIYGHDGQNWESERAPQGQQVSGLQMRPDCRGFVGNIEKVVMQ